MGQQNVDVAAGGQATSVAAADDDVVVRVQVFDLSSQKFFHVLDFLSGDSELEVVEMLEADLLTLRQARLVFQLKKTFSFKCSFLGTRKSPKLLTLDLSSSNQT